MPLYIVRFRLVAPAKEARFQVLMQAHHYRGALHTLGRTLWDVSVWGEQWLALLTFSAPV